MTHYLTKASVISSKVSCIGSCSSQGEEVNGLLAQNLSLACKSTPTDLDGNAEYVDFEVNMRRQKHDLRGREKKNTGFSSQIGTKLRDLAVGLAVAGCYSQAPLSSNDSKTRYSILVLFQVSLSKVHRLSSA